TDGVIGNEITNATTGGGLTRSGLGTAVSPYTLGISTNGVTTTHLADNSVTSAKIADGTISATDIATGAVTSDKILNGTIVAADLGQMSATSGQVLKWNGSAWAPAADAGITAEVDGIIGNEVTDATASGGLTRSGSGTAAAPYTLGISTNGVTTTHLADNSVTSAKIVNGTIDATDLGQMGALNGQVLKWNGITWQPAALAAEVDGIVGNEITDATASGGLTRSGAGTAASPYTLGISTGGVTTTHLAANAVTSAKIADGTITAADLGQMSATSGQVLKWNGTVWAPAADAGIATESDGIVGNEVTNATTNGGLARSGSGTTESPYTLGIATGGIATAHLADNTVTAAKIVDGTITNADIDSNANISGSKIAAGSITTTQIAAGTIAAADLGQMGATTDQVLTWNAGGWQPKTPSPMGVTAVSGSNGITVSNGTTTPAVSLPTGNTSGEVLKWNGTAWTSAPDAGIAAETDGIVGNEVTNATINGGLTRSGSGTAESPYTLGISTGGVTSEHIANGTIATVDLANQAVTTAKIGNGAIYPSKLNVDGDRGFVWMEREDDDDYFTTYTQISGSQISDNTITNVDINASAGITLNKLSAVNSTVGNSGASQGQVLTWDDGGWQPKTPTSSSGVTSVSGSSGITVTNGTTTPNVSIGEGSISSYHIGNGAVTSDKILNGTIKAEDLNSMGATSGQSLVYKSGAWAPATTWATPVTINGGSGTALSTGSITTGDYKDIYEWTGLEAGLYNLRLRIGGSTAKFILQSTVAFGTSVPFEVTSNTSNDGTVEIMFNYYYTGGSLKLKAYCTGGCPGRVHDLYLARF
ncbi:MAG: hypothetical protein LBN93_00195, partial [Candidatus Symbiothrix sp.]|nr:hypothetical protein [Candidatus Symbiothrix sp.]